MHKGVDSGQIISMTENIADCWEMGHARERESDTLRCNDDDVGVGVTESMNVCEVKGWVGAVPSRTITAHVFAQNRVMEYARLQVTKAGKEGERQAQHRPQ